MVSIALHIAPIFLLIGLGYLLNDRAIFADRFWNDTERLTFYFLFPALLIYSIGGADLGGLLNLLPMAGALITAALVVAGFAIRLKHSLSSPPLNIDGPGFCSVFQGVTRPNTYLGLAAAFALFDEAGLALMAVAVVAIIPLVNVLAVLVHQRWSQVPDITRQPQSKSDIALDAVKNPVVAACLIGAVLNLSGVGLPPVIGPTLGILGKGALPLGLMAVGAGLNFHTLKEAPNLYLGVSAVKLVILPTLTWAIAVMMGVGGIGLTVAVLFAALPVSATSYVMSRQMNGDGPMMAAIVSATTLASLLTLPIIIAVLS